MMTIMISGEKVSVEGQPKAFICGSYGQYQCRVVFGDGWKEYERYVIFGGFKNKRKSIRMTSMDATISIPDEMIEDLGLINISAIGVNGAQRIYTNIFRSIPVVNETETETEMEKEGPLNGESCCKKPETVL